MRAPTRRGVCLRPEGREPTESAQIAKIEKTIVYGSSAHLPGGRVLRPTAGALHIHSHSRDFSRREPPRTQRVVQVEIADAIDPRVCYLQALSS